MSENKNILLQFSFVWEIFLAYSGDDMTCLNIDQNSKKNNTNIIKSCFRDASELDLIVIFHSFS